MAKLRLSGWTVLVGVAAIWLLRSSTWPPTGDDPAVTTMAVVRLVAGALAAYLLVATILAVRLPRLAPSFVRRLVAAAVGGGLLLAPVAASAAPAAGPAPADAPVLRRVPDATTTSTTTPAPQPSAAPAPPADEVVVAPGDHLWAIAERTLAARLGRAPSDAEIVPFWTRLIELNRERLVTGDPDLVVPGQRFALPSS